MDQINGTPKWCGVWCVVCGVFAVVLDKLRSRATLDGPGSAASGGAKVCQS